jgi:hypothetical protein
MARNSTVAQPSPLITLDFSRLAAFSEILTLPERVIVFADPKPILLNGG